MNYFPSFLDIKDMNIIVVGGGKIATDKLQKILLWKANNITIIAPFISFDMQKLIKQYKIILKQRMYKIKDIKKAQMIIVAVDNIDLQKDIYKQSKKYNCLCNCVDSAKYCSFIFPAIIKKDNLTIAISTDGISPAFTKYFKIFLSKFIPNDIDIFLRKMKKYRKTLPKGEKRIKFLDKIAYEYIKNRKNK